MSDLVKEISIDLIDDPVVAMRSDVYDSEIESLAASIKEYGLLEPLVVRPVGNRFELIAGHRRLVACRQISKILLFCKIVEADDKLAYLLRIQENSHRLDVNPVDEAVFLQRVINEVGCSVAELAKMVKRSDAYIYSRLDVLDFPNYLIEAVGEKQISLSAASILNKIEDDAYRHSLVEIAAKDGISAMTADRWWQMWKLNLLPATPTPESMQAITFGGEQNESFIACVRCGGPGKVRDMVTVWVHKNCPPSAEPQM